MYKMLKMHNNNYHNNNFSKCSCVSISSESTDRLIFIMFNDLSHKKVTAKGISSEKKEQNDLNSPLRNVYASQVPAI